MINEFRNLDTDVTIKDTSHARKVFLTVNQSNRWYRNDSLARHGLPRLPGEKFNQFISGVDSLQDTLDLKDLSLRFESKIKKENTDVPFTIIRLDSNVSKAKASYNEVIIGFSKPVIYRLQLGNTFPYLMNRISWPIIFSIFIIAITIGSFILLYRSIFKQQRLVSMKNDFISNITS